MIVNIKQWPPSIVNRRISITAELVVEETNVSPEEVAELNRRGVQHNLVAGKGLRVYLTKIRLFDGKSL